MSVLAPAPSAHIDAEATVVAERTSAGTTRCTTLRNAPPLTFRPTPGGLTLVGTAAGPVGGDRLRLRVEVRSGASLAVDAVGATIVLPGPAALPSSFDQTVSVADGAGLLWAPEPTVISAGVDHRATTRIRLGTGASVLWIDTTVLGRSGEEPGLLRSRLVVDGDDGPILRTGSVVDRVALRSPAVAGTMRAGTQILATGRARAALEVAVGPDVHGAVSTLRTGDLLMNALSPSVLALARLVAAVAAAGHDALA